MRRTWSCSWSSLWTMLDGDWCVHLGSSHSLSCLGYGKGEERYSTHAHVSLHGANSCMRGGSDTNDPREERRR